MCRMVISYAPSFLRRRRRTHASPPSQPKEGRSLIREQLTSSTVQPPLKLSFLELQANHAFIRDEMSKVRHPTSL